MNDVQRIIADVEAGIVRIADIRDLPLTTIWMEWAEQDKNLYHGVTS